MSRIPDNYERPTSESRYAKLEAWENRYRVLSSPLIWYSYWNHENKKVRVETKGEINESDIWPNKFSPEKPQYPKHFWAFVVYDYNNSGIRILELDKAAAIEAFDTQLQDPDYSNPTEYDIKITRTGEKLETNYVFSVGKHKPIDEAITKEYEEMGINLDALLDGKDPFSTPKLDTEATPF